MQTSKFSGQNMNADARRQSIWNISETAATPLITINAEKKGDNLVQTWQE